MAELKLGRLLDRRPVKVTISLSPDLGRALDLYAEAYRDHYGEAEPVAVLIPAMIEAFLKSDRGFAQRRRNKVQQ